MELYRIIKEVGLSCWMEAKICFTRDFLVVFIIGLVLFFTTYTDFPFTPDDSEDLSDIAELAAILVQWCIVLAVFSRTVLRDMDNREYFNQHPLNYRYHFTGKCVYIFLVITIWDLIGFGIRLSHDLYYSNSLTVLNVYDTSAEFFQEIPRTIFTASFILFISLFRPLHYALIIGIESASFYAIQTWPSIESKVPLSTEDYFPNLLWGFIFWLLGALLFEARMTEHPREIASSWGQRWKRIKQVRALRWTPVILAAATASASFSLAKNETEISPIEKMKAGLMDSVRHLEDQSSSNTDHFSFKYATQNQWIKEELSATSDFVWKQLHDEFSMPLRSDLNIDVFIKASEKHMLGSTRGSFIVINAETIAASNNSKTVLQNTLRHELAHVLINQISDFQFLSRTDIFHSFLHEGLAQLVEYNWQSDDPALIREAALHYKVFDERLLNLIPELDYFDDYDYALNYSLGYVFWGEFVKIYGREKVREFLEQLGKEHDRDGYYEGAQFLFYKVDLAEVDFYKVLHATTATLGAAYEGLDDHMKLETKGLKEFKAARLSEKTLLIPYYFETAKSARCVFRRKDALTTRSVQLKPKDYSGRTGGICSIPEVDLDQVQVSVKYGNGVKFRSRWSNIPEG